MPSTTRTEKLGLRLTPQAKRRIVAAAEAENLSVNEFVLKSALDRADESLGDKRIWKLSPEKWAEFQTLLDAPPRDIPALRKLLTEPSVFERSRKR
jgi:uncharacterized protein (DUF1778 family)